jgi:hypothetical protein
MLGGALSVPSERALLPALVKSRPKMMPPNKEDHEGKENSEGHEKTDKPVRPGEIVAMIAADSKDVAKIIRVLRTKRAICISQTLFR